MSFTSVTIISPEAANGRNVVALGVTKALAAAGKTGVFRPAVCRKDTFTDVLIEASNAGLSREQSVGVCPKRARNDKEGSRADIVAAYTQAVETARSDAMVIVGTDRSAVNDPAMFSFNADFAADLQSPVLLAVCTIERTPEQVKSTVEASTKVIEDAGSKVVGVFITGCDDTQPDPLKACFVDYPVPVWTLPAVDFNDDDAISKADEAFATNVDAAELTAVLESPFDAPTTPYAFQYGLLGKAKADKKTIVLPEGNEDRIIKAADYLLERDIVDLIIVGDENAILARGQELGLKSLGKAKFQAKDDETVLEPMVAKLCELRAKKGMTEEQARKQLADDSYFGTMLVVMGMADGLVSGSVNSTANTVRPALQVIKTKPGTSLVSGAFLMCFKDHVAVFADCAINLNPNAEQLAEIAIQSAETAKRSALNRGGHAVLFHAGLRKRTRRRPRRGSHHHRQRQGSRPCGGRIDPVRRGMVSDRGRDQSQGRSGGGPCQCVRIPGSVRGQHRIQGGTAFLGSGRRRAGAAGSQPPGERSEPWRHVQDIINTIALTAIEAQ